MICPESTLCALVVETCIDGLKELITELQKVLDQSRSVVFDLKPYKVPSCTDEIFICDIKIGHHCSRRFLAFRLHRTYTENSL